MSARAVLAAAALGLMMVLAAGCGPASEGDTVKTSSLCPAPGLVSQEMEPAPAPASGALPRPALDLAAPKEVATATFGLG